MPHPSASVDGLRAPARYANASVTVADPSLGSWNVGDEVIANSALDVLRDGLAGYRVHRISTHVYPGLRPLRFIRASRCALVFGSNLLGPGVRSRRPLTPWRVTTLDATVNRGKYVLMGVGWITADRPWTRGVAAKTRALLSPELIHSVRDEHSAERLHEIGVDNHLLTGCPTTWKLDQVDVRRSRGERAVVALNGASDDPRFVKRFAGLVADRYEQVAFFPQMPRDLTLVPHLPRSWEVIGPNLWNLERALCQGEVDYLGTRLHAGIRAMQLGVRAFIVQTDHRAGSVCSVVQLRTFTKDELDEVGDLVDTDFENRAIPPRETINRYLAQFDTSI